MPAGSEARRRSWSNLLYLAHSPPSSAAAASAVIGETTGRPRTRRWLRRCWRTNHTAICVPRVHPGLFSGWCDVRFDHAHRWPRGECPCESSPVRSACRPLPAVVPRTRPSAGSDCSWGAVGCGQRAARCTCSGQGEPKAVLVRCVLRMLRVRGAEAVLVRCVVHMPRVGGAPGGPCALPVAHAPGRGCPAVLVRCLLHMLRVGEPRRFLCAACCHA